ncbi:MAG: hypothetical protein O7G29_03510 [Acidobacteria bacterium]|nr:hypothetical protein [Acidobacteriota bacterium]
MSNFFSSPEIIRYLRSEARRGRLVTGLVTANLIAFAIYLMATQSEDLGETLVTVLFMVQGVLLLVYGTVRTTASVLAERTERTWDFQRLTPLSSWELTWGKLIGAPVFPYFLLLSLVPWVVLGVSLSAAVGWGELLVSYLKLLGIGFAVLSLGLLFSAYHDRDSRTHATTAGGAILGFFGFQYLTMLDGTSPMISFYGWQISLELFAPASAAAFGLWFLAGAKWRIGEDLQEPDYFWRFPAFLLFTYLYLLGLIQEPAWNGGHYVLLLGLPLIAVYGAALGSPFGPHELRRWSLCQSVPDKLNQSPSWAKGLAALFGLALLSFFLGSPSEPASSWFLILLPAFAARDLAFVQWCKLGQLRRPEVVAVVYLTLAYALPSLVLVSFEVENGFFLFAPVPQADTTLFLTVLPGLGQAAVMTFLLRARIRKLVEPALEGPR